VAEKPVEIRRSVDVLADAVERSCDVDAVIGIAAEAPDLETQPLPVPERQGQCRIAVAQGKAFSFSYPDNLEALEQAGAELLPFDPLTQPQLPARTQGLLAGGGFPEVYAEGLSENRPLLEDVRRHAEQGLPIWAECGGLLWLAHSLDGHPMAQVIDAKARMSDRLTLGYRRATPTTDNPVATAGDELRGHEFHYSTIEPAGDAFELMSRFGQGRAGFASSTLLATYLHMHLAARPDIADRFVGTVVAAARRGKPV
jgi:cobyrinic acid a,c-diamide synthase